MCVGEKEKNSWHLLFQTPGFPVTVVVSQAITVVTAKKREICEGFGAGVMCKEDLNYPL